MNALVIDRVRNLAGTLAELKVKVRTALATELASAVGTAVRDVLIVAIVDRMVSMPSRTPTRPPGTRGWRTDDDADRFDPARDSWSDDYDDHGGRAHRKYEYDDRNEEEPMPSVPTAAVLAVGVNIGRWWIAHKGTVGTALGLGVLTTALGLTGGNFARAALAVLAAATDVLTAETAIARLDHS